MLFTYNEIFYIIIFDSCIYIFNLILRREFAHSARDGYKIREHSSILLSHLLPTHKHTSILSNPFPILVFSSSNQTLAHNSRKSFCTYSFIKPKRSVTSHITKLFLLFVRSRVYVDIFLRKKEIDGKKRKIVYLSTGMHTYRRIIIRVSWTRSSQP